ncbi:MAG: hypothetical protein Q7T37_01585 [bacterium]|nr:hypothetical protein [bacterium]MDO8742319.1 hypothetical protein [bacterium]
MRHVARFFGIASLIFLVLTAVVACSGGGDGAQSPVPSSPPEMLPPPPPPGTHKISGYVQESTASGSAYGRQVNGATIQVEPGNLTTSTDSNGNWELYVPNDTYTVSAQYGGRSLAPASLPAVVNNADVSNIDFASIIPVLAGRAVAYIGTGAAGNNSALKMITPQGVTEVVLDNPNIQPMNIIPFRGGISRIAFEPMLGGNERVGGIRTINLSTRAQTVIVPDNGFFAPGFASSAVGRIFDTIRDPDTGVEYVTLSSPCAPPFCPQLQNDVFVVIADGSLMNLRVTDDGALKHSPVFVAKDPVTGYVTMLYVAPGTGEMWRQVINPLGNPDRVGGLVLVESNVVDDERAISVSPDYTRFAFVRNVNGVSHIIVRPVNGGSELDLGEGSNPYWTTDGSDLIMYTVGPVVLAVSPDGTGKVEIPVPADLRASPTWVVLVGT